MTIAQGLYAIIATAYLFGGFLFGLAALLSYVSEIHREARYFSVFETLEFSKAVAFAFLCWPFVWLRMGEQRKLKAEAVRINKS